MTRERASIPRQYTWDLTHIYGGWDAWRTDLERLQAKMDRYADFRGKLADGPNVVLAAYRLGDELSELAYRTYAYPMLESTTDSKNNDVQAKLQQVSILFAKFRQATAWFTPELLRVPRETMERWIDETPELHDYRFPILETYRQQEHVLDEAGEQILSYASQLLGTPGDVFTMLSVADADFPEVELSTGETIVASNGNYQATIQSSRVQADREAVFKAHFGIYERHKNTYAAIYNSILQASWFRAQARKYGSTTEMALDSDAIPVAVLETLIETAKAGSEPLRRYHAMRKKVLGLERYRYFDGYVPLADVDWKFPYDDVKPLVVESARVFGAEYQQTVERAFDERWIDVYENDGKRSGAFSMGVYGVHPYMLLNHTDTMSDAFTIAHEMGHTMHTVLAQETQPLATSNYSTFVAEVASMTNEDFFLELLLERTEDAKKRVALLEHAIQDIAAGFYRQAMFADYELEAHRAVESGTPITADYLQKIYLESLNAFFGDALDDQDWYRNTWARIPHFFNSPYYVWQYATSKAASARFYRMMSTGEPGARREVVDRYLELLRSGGNDHPIAQLKKAGVDFTTPDPVEALVAEMNRLVDELEAELRRLEML